MASTAANAGSSAMSGAAPVGSGMGAGTPAGGSSKAGLVSATGPADEDDKDPEDRRDQPSGERLAYPPATFNSLLFVAFAVTAVAPDPSVGLGAVSYACATTR